MRFLVAICTVFLALSVAISYAPTIAHNSCMSAIPPSVPGVLTQPSATPDLLVINEVLTTPHFLWLCSDSSQPTTEAIINNNWIEVYNPQNQPFDLHSVHTNFDSGPDTNKFYFPIGAAIPSHGFLVLFPGSDQPFQSTRTSTLRLVIAGIIIDQVIIPTLSLDTSYARIPDGSAKWQTTTIPTIGTSNMQSQSPVITTSATTHQETKKSSKDTNQQNHHTKGTTNHPQNSGETHSSNTTGDTTGAQTPTPIIQPDWSTLQFPDTITPSYPKNTQIPVTSEGPPTTTDHIDISKIILFSLLIVALALSLLWCWRLFRTS